jgi:hypothetical protein
MLGDGKRDAQRTERYLDGLMAADERRAPESPVDADLDPAIRLAARELRSGLVRVHPSFRFEESLSARLAAGAARMRAGLPVESVAVVAPSAVTPIPRRTAAAGSVALAVAAAADVVGTADVAADGLAGPGVALVTGPVVGPDGGLAASTQLRGILPSAPSRRLPDMTARQSRPFIVGGVGVASAAISIGAVYVAWRHSHPASSRMGRAARAAHGRTGQSGHGRRYGVINGILGVMS